MPLIPGKYERIRREMACVTREDPRYILVCPTVSDMPEYFAESHGMAIVSELLARYPDHKTVFRPRPKNRQRPEIKNIVSTFSDHPRFVYDDLDDYAEPYARGTVLITDRSSTGQTFTLATFQPSVYFPQGPEIISITHKDLIGHGCFKVTTFDELFLLVDKIIASPTMYKDKIQEIYNKIYFNCLPFSENFFKFVNCILNDSIHSKWLRLTLSDNNIIGNSIHEYEESILSIFKNKHRIITTRDFVQNLGIIPRYMSLKMKENETFAKYIFDAIMPEYIWYFKDGHASYAGVLREPMNMIYFNLSFDDYEDFNVFYFKIVADTIFKRNNTQSINDFMDDIYKCPEAYRIFSDFLEYKRSKQSDMMFE